MKDEDLETKRFKLDGQTLRNARGGEYLVLNYTRRGVEEKELQVSLQKGRAGLRELKWHPWFNAGLNPAATKSFFQTYVRSRIVYGVIVCKSSEAICQADNQLLTEYFSALLKRRVPTGVKQKERLCLLYGIHTIDEELVK